MSNAWMAKLAHQISLSDPDVAALTAAQGQSKTFASRDVIASEGDPADTMITVLSGWAARCKTLRGGERQIVGFLLPGDFTAVYPGLLHRRTDTIWALTRCEVAELHADAVVALVQARPAVDQVLRHGAMRDFSVSQEWLANLGGRSAERRLAHLFCEFLERLRGSEQATQNSFALPITQSILGAALGLSPAHVNRTLQSLHVSGRATLEGGWVVIDDPVQFKRFAGFDARYLDIHPTQ